MWQKKWDKERQGSFDASHSCSVGGGKCTFLAGFNRLPTKKYEEEARAQHSTGFAERSRALNRVCVF